MNDTKDKKIDTSITKIERLNDIENQYETCACWGNGKTDRRLLEFMSKFIVLLTVLLFSCTMTAIGDGDKNIYINLIVMILSIFLPSPSIKNKK